MGRLDEVQGCGAWKRGSGKLTRWWTEWKFAVCEILEVMKGFQGLQGREGFTHCRDIDSYARLCARSIAMYRPRRWQRQTGT